MNRIEFVKKLTSVAGIPYSEGEIFLEMFLRKVSAEALPDQKLLLPEVGSFLLNKSAAGPQSVSFTPEKDSQSISFYLPEETSLINYSRFNISIGKPVLPLNSRSEVKAFYPQDNMAMLESKSDKVFSFLQISDDIIVAETSAQAGENDNWLKTDETIELAIEQDAVVNDELSETTFDEISDPFFEETDELIIEEEKEEEFFSKLEAVKQIETPDEETALTETSMEDLINNPFLESDEIIFDESDLKSLDKFDEERPEKSDEIIFERADVISFEEEEFKELSSGLEIEEEVISELNDKENDEIFYSLTSEFPDETDSPEIEVPGNNLQEISPEAEISFQSDQIEYEKPLNTKAVTEEISISFEEPLSLEDIIEEKALIQPDSFTDFRKDYSIPELVDTSFREEDAKDELLSELSLIEEPSEIPTEIPQPVPQEIPEIPEEIPQTPESPEPQPEDENLLTSVSEANSLILDNFDEDLNFEGVIEEIKPDPDEKVFRFETDTPDEQPQEFNLADLSAEEIEDNKTEPAEATFGELAEKLPDNTDDNSVSSLQKSDVDEIEDPGKEYQRVKSLTREFFNLSEVEQNDNMLSWDFGESEQLEKDIRKLTRAFDEIDPEHGKENKDGFTPVKSRKATYEWSPGTLPEIESDYKSEFEDSDTTDFSMDEDIFKSEETEVKESKENLYQQKQQSRKESVVDQKKIKKDYARAEKRIKSEEIREQKKSYSFIITVGVLAVITIAVLIYYNFNIFKSTPEVKTKVTPTVIERNDQVPVMMQEPNVTPSEQQPAADNVSAEVETNKPVETTPLNTEIIRVSDGLYKRGEVYYLQISSWKTKSKAEQETSSLIEKGYKSEILTSTINSVLVYRVLVGEFNSPEEAKNFNTNN